MSITRARNEIPTIDVNLVTIAIKTMVEGSLVVTEFGFDTANQIEVEPQTEDQDSVKLIIKGKLKAQKPPTSVITGHQITLHDNVFNPELVKALQGGTILYWQEEGKTTMGETVTDFGVAKYTPPVVGSDDEGSVFDLNAYSAIYNAAGIITGYERITYPNCKGVPVAFNTEDNTFRTSEYTINSAPNTGEAPYVIEYLKALPELTGTTNMEGPGA